MSSKIHNWRSRLILLLSVLIILWAMLFGVLRLLLPHVTDYGDNIREQLAKQLGVPVSIQSVDAEMWWWSPRLKLSDVDIFDPDGTRQVLHVDEIVVGFDWLASARLWQLQLGFVAFQGSQLQVQHFADGRWQVQGITLPEADEGPLQLPPELRRLLSNTSIYFHDIELDWRDDQHNLQHLMLSDVNIALLNAAPNHQLEINLQLPAAYGGHVQMLLDITGPLEQPAKWRGSLYAEAEQVQLKSWFNDYWQWFDFTANGVVDANVWVDWQPQHLQRVHAVINGDDMALHYLNGNVHSWKLDQLAAKLRWQQQKNGWQLDVSGLQIQRGGKRWLQPSALALNLDNAKQQLALRASYLQVNDMVYLAGLVNSFVPQQHNTDWNQHLQAWQPQGDVFDVDLSVPLQQPEQLTFSARFEDAGFVSQRDAVPTITGLDGNINLVQQQAHLQLDSQGVRLDFQKLFRQPITLQQINADIFVQHSATQTEIIAEDIEAITPHIRTRSRLHVRAPKDAPAFMDLLTQYDHGQGAYTGVYLPTGIMGKDTVNWLDRSIKQGDLQGGFLFYGQLQDFPFNNSEGVMLAQFDVKNALLDYQSGWPGMTQLDARVRFRNNAMLIDQGRGKILGADASNVTVAIDDMAHDPLLQVNGDVRGPLPEMIRFVAQSPLKKPLSFVSTLQTKGDAHLALGLQIPLSGNAHETVNGRLSFAGNELLLPEQHYLFKAVNGVLNFTESGFSSERLRASLDNFPLNLRIDPLEIAGIAHSRIAVQGYAPLASLLAPLPDWQHEVSGGSNWTATLDIPLQSRPDGVELAVTASGSLQGVASRLPFFLAKPAEAAGDLNLTLDVLANGNMNIYAANSADYSVTAKRRDKRWQVQADSLMMQGEASFFEDFEMDTVMDVKLMRLDLARLQAAQPSANAASDSDPEKNNGLSPHSIPPLNVRIDRLDWNKVTLQDVRLRTSRSKAGMEIDSLKFNGPAFNVDAKGSWHSSWRTPHITRLAFKLHADDLGLALNQMDITDKFVNTSGDAEFNWRWAAAPQDFSWAGLSGDGNIQLENGRIKQVNAGAGRLLGIFNFRTLLALDFGDQVREGFAFDKFNVKLRFANGNVWNDNLKIESKVAAINMKGRVGLVQEDFDQTIVVEPVLGNTLTLIGTVAGGPVTGVMVHVFQKLLRVDRIARYKYAVKGQWDNPDVKLIDAPLKKTDSENNN